MTGMDLFHQGGFIMYPLLVFSVLVWTIALYKIFFLRGFAKEYQRVASAVQAALEGARVSEVKTAYHGATSLITRPHEVLVDERLTPEERSDRLSRRLTETNAGLRQHLWILGTIASSAPFVGLFGTVLGIMESFKAIGSSGKSGFSVVAAGISESLIATAAGIIVAVVALLFYNFLQTRVTNIAQDFRLKLEDAMELMSIARRQGK
mgnify:CR=1 FL=1